MDKKKASLGRSTTNREKERKNGGKMEKKREKREKKRKKEKKMEKKQNSAKVVKKERNQTNGGCHQETNKLRQIRSTNG